jgi:hypothetical protein
MESSSGHVYKIWNDINDDVYVGSTFTPLDRVFAWHCLQATFITSDWHALHNLIRKLGPEHFRIESIEEFPFNARKVMQEKTEEYREKLSKWKPEDFLSDYQLCLKHEREQRKADPEWQQQRKEKDAARSKKYREENPEAVAAKNKRYWMMNAGKIYERRNAKCECECGLSYTLKNKSTHYKTQVHAKRMEELQSVQAQTTDS